MGKRRIRNLQKLHAGEIIGFDARKARVLETKRQYHVKTYNKFNEALKEKPDAFVISTPPDLHKKYADIAIDNKIHFFTEVNLSSSEIKSLIKKIKEKSIIGVPSCTLLFHPAIIELKKIIQKNTIGKIYSIHHHFGHYLPNWHPWEDYRKFYVSKKSTGAAREIVPFELVWLTSIFHDVESVFGIVKKVSTLKTNIDDLYQIMMKFRNNVYCSLIIDVFTRPSIKETKIIGEHGTIFIDFSGLIKIKKERFTKKIKFQLGPIQKGYKKNTGAEPMYEQEMKSFINAIKKKKKYPLSLSDEYKILKILDAIEQSNKINKKISLKNSTK